MVKFFSGLAIGIAAVFAVQWYGVDNLKQNGQDGVVAVQEQVEEHRASTCERRYLEATSCLQHFRQQICENEIQKACNPQDPNYHGIIPERKGVSVSGK